MSKINPFELPEEYKLELLKLQEEKDAKSLAMQLQLDLHDDYDLTSQPAFNCTPDENIRYEGK